MATAISLSKIEEILGDRSGDLLGHKCGTVPADMLHVPGPRFVEEVWVGSDRSPRVLRALQSLFDHGRLGGRDHLLRVPVGVRADRRRDPGGLPAARRVGGGSSGAPGAIRGAARAGLSQAVPLLSCGRPRRGGRVVDGGGLENRWAKASGVRIPPSPPTIA